MNGHPHNEPGIAAGTSRRDVLRGGAIGVGALVGAMGLVNAAEVSSEAERLDTARAIYVRYSTFSGHDLAQVRSFSFGGEVHGSPAPAPVFLTQDTFRNSPRLLRIYAEAITIPQVEITEYQSNVQGVEKLYTKITFTNSRITSFHTDVVTSANGGTPHTHDVMQLTFGSATVERLDSASTYTWTLPT
jgi:type VI protein secretion system component Hcp